MLSLCPCGFPSGPPASSHCPNVQVWLGNLASLNKLIDWKVPSGVNEFVVVGLHVSALWWTGNPSRVFPTSLLATANKKWMSLVCSTDIRLNCFCMYHNSSKRSKLSLSLWYWSASLGWQANICIAFLQHQQNIIIILCTVTKFTYRVVEALVCMWSSSSSSSQSSVPMKTVVSSLLRVLHYSPSLLIKEILINKPVVKKSLCLRLCLFSWWT